MTVSTLTVVPETPVSGTAPAAEPHAPSWYWRSTDLTRQTIARASRPDYPAWLEHVRPAAGCTQPVRLAGTSHTVEAATGRILSTLDTATMPDGVIYKPCGNRRASVCPSCAQRYKRDAYQVVRSGRRDRRGHAVRQPDHAPTAGR